MTIINTNESEKSDVDPDFDGTLRVHFLERRKLELTEEIREIDNKITEINKKSSSNCSVRPSVMDGLFS